MAYREQYRERITEALDYLQGELHQARDELRDVEFIANKPAQDLTQDETRDLQQAVLAAIKNLGTLIDKLN